MKLNDFIKKLERYRMTQRKLGKHLILIDSVRCENGKVIIKEIENDIES